MEKAEKKLEDKNADLLKDIEFSGFGGMSIGADPIVGGVLVTAAAQNRPLQGFMVRNQQGFGGLVGIALKAQGGQIRPPFPRGLGR